MNDVPQTFTIDVSSAIKLMPEGVYLGQFEKFTVKQGPAGPYILWTFKILCDIDGDTEFADRTLFPMTSMSASAKNFLVEFLLATGMSPEQLAHKFEFNPENYIGQRAYVHVHTTLNPKNNREQDTVKSFVTVEYEEEEEEVTEEAFAAIEEPTEEPEVEKEATTKKKKK